MSNIRRRRRSHKSYTLACVTAGSYDAVFGVTAGVSWAAARDAASAPYNGVDAPNLGGYSCFVGGQYQNYRTALSFDTSSIPSNAVITAATLDLVYVSKDGLGQVSYVVQAALSDPPVQGNYAIANWGTDKTYPLPASSTAGTVTTVSISPLWVTPGGRTEIGLRGVLDIDNTEPTLTSWQGTKWAGDENATYAAPVLTVTYVA